MEWKRRGGGNGGKWREDQGSRWEEGHTRDREGGTYYSFVPNSDFSSGAGTVGV